MKKTTYDGHVAFEWEPGEEELRKEFEVAIADQASASSFAQAIMTAMQKATQKRQEMWAEVAAKIERDTGWDLGRQILDYSNFKRLFVVLPNPNEKKIIKPAVSGDVPRGH